MKHWHLSYHYLNLPGEKKPGLSMDVSRFREQLQAIKAGGYEVVSLTEYARMLKHGRSLPEKLVTLSFDDGLKDGYTRAYPLLQSYGFSASFLVIGCTLEGDMPPVIAFQALIKLLGAERLEREILPAVLVGTPYATLLDQTQYDIRDAKKPEPPEVRRIKWVFNHFLPQSLKFDVLNEIFEKYVEPAVKVKLLAEYFMTVDELREMAKNGMDIVSHSYSHPPFNVCGAGEIAAEAERSRKVLKRTMSKEVDVFGWPFGGKFGPREKQAVGKYYRNAFNFYANEAAVPKIDQVDFLDLPRIDAGSVEPSLIRNA